MSGECEICHEHTLECECKADLQDKRIKEILLDFLVEAIHKFARDQAALISLKDSRDFINEWVDENLD